MAGCLLTHLTHGPMENEATRYMECYTSSTTIHGASHLFTRCITRTQLRWFDLRSWLCVLTRLPFIVICLVVEDPFKHDHFLFLAAVIESFFSTPSCACRRASKMLAQIDTLRWPIMFFCRNADESNRPPQVLPDH